LQTKQELLQAEIEAHVTVVFCITASSS
jgi:hypothetical protein